MGKAIIAITPELLYGFLDLEKFKIWRTQYNFYNDRIEFVVENDIFPETPPEERLPNARPTYTSKYEDGKQVGVVMSGISVWDKGESVFVAKENIKQFPAPVKPPPEKEATE